MNNLNMFYMNHKKEMFIVIALLSRARLLVVSTMTNDITIVLFLATCVT